MKRLFLTIIAIALVISNVFGRLGQYAQRQRSCGSQLGFEEMQRTDSARYQRFMDHERLLETQLLNSRSIPAGTITIPVVVHVVYNINNASAQNISEK